MDGHKEDGKFHPHTTHESAIHASDVKQNKTKVKETNWKNLSQSKRIDLAFQPTKNGNSVKPYLSEYGDEDDGYGLDPDWNRESRTEHWYSSLADNQKEILHKLASADGKTTKHFRDLPKNVQLKLIEFNTKTIRFDGWKGSRNADDLDRDRFKKKYPATKGFTKAEKFDREPNSTKAITIEVVTKKKISEQEAEKFDFNDFTDDQKKIAETLV